MRTTARRTLGSVFSATMIATGWLLAGASRAEESSAPGADVAAISWWMGNLPLYCTAASEALEICTWRGRDSLNVACEIQRSEGASGAAGRCVSRPDNEQMGIWSGFAGLGARRGDGKVSGKEALRRSTESAWAGRRTLWEVTEFVGVGPDRCALGTPLTCTWIAVRMTPGYIDLARLSDLNGSKIRVLCRFPSYSAPRTDDACVFAPADEGLESSK
jgi:hypothetical protein